MPLAIAGVVAVMVAILALLVYYGAEALGRVFKAWTPDIGIPGLGNLRDFTAAVIDTGVDLVRRLMHPIVAPFVDLLAHAATWITRIIFGAAHLGERLAFGLLRVVTVHIPVLAARLIHYTNVAVHVAVVELGARIHTLRLDVRSWLGDLRDWARGLLAAAVAGLRHELAALRDWTIGRFVDLRNWTRGLLAAAVAGLEHELAVLRDWTVQRVRGLDRDLHAAVDMIETDLAAGVHAAETFATAAASEAASAASDALNATAATAAAISSGLILDELPELLGELASDFPDIRAALGEIDLAGVGDIAGALALTGALDLVLTRYLRQCGVPNCRNLGGFGRYLHALEAGLGAGALLAALVEIVTDPHGAAHAVQDDFTGLLSGAVETLRELVA